MKFDIVFFGFIFKVLHLYSAQVVEVTLVPNEDFNRVGVADPFNRFVVVR